MMTSMLAYALAIAVPQDAHVQSLPDYGLTITFPQAFADVAAVPTQNPQLKGRWSAKLEGVALELDLYVLASEEFGFAEPDDVTEITLENVRDPKHGDPGFWFDKTLLVQGPFGWAAYGSIGWGPLHDKDGTNVVGTLFVLGGLVEKNGYSLEVIAQPALSDAQAKTVVEFLKTGVAYKGTVRNPKWTDDEARDRWNRDAPEATHKKLEKPLRTEHYLILTNSSSGKKFGDAMEKCYASVQKTYPFQDVAGQRLMPVFLFRTADEYYDYYAKIAKITVEAARRSKGHAWRDYYATWFEAPNDPVHVHEGTHQIFSNRMHLSGGGSWFQEGVAEYMSTTPNDRNPAANLVKKGKHVPLAEFVKMPSLLYSADEKAAKGDTAEENYHLAALLIEFLRESKWGKAHFQDFLHVVGRIRRNDAAAIDRGLKAVYGCDLKELEDQWVDYCKKR
ncbi:MAG TPA: hypothetical protein VGR31_09525 [Planctomycetota bacterium]|jgi:hypothetical protein|nr:hypothetical protein [Planctomycetota bacterium]